MVIEFVSVKMFARLATCSALRFLRSLAKLHLLSKFQLLLFFLVLSYSVSGKFLL
jgi:hypothetical protein